MRSGIEARGSVALQACEEVGALRIQIRLTEFLQRGNVFGGVSLGGAFQGCVLNVAERRLWFQVAGLTGRGHRRVDQ